MGSVIFFLIAGIVVSESSGGQIWSGFGRRLHLEEGDWKGAPEEQNFGGTVTKGGFDAAPSRSPVAIASGLRCIDSNFAV